MNQALVLLQEYIRRHNEGVRRGDFVRLVQLFSVDAEVIFGPPHDLRLVGKHEIAQAFRTLPPNDELVVHASKLLADTTAEAKYTWVGSPTGAGGVIHINAREGRIYRLLVTFTEQGASA